MSCLCGYPFTVGVSLHIPGRNTSAGTNKAEGEDCFSLSALFDATTIAQNYGSLWLNFQKSAFFEISSMPRRRYRFVEA